MNGLSKEIAKEAKDYGRMGGKCLHEAIIVEEKVVELMPESYPAQRERLNTLSDMLAKRSRWGGGRIRDLNQAIQIAAERTWDPYFDNSEVEAFLRELQCPLHYLDFETIIPADTRQRLEKSHSAAAST